MRNRSALIIVEGPQGAGKTTLTNKLREKMPYTNLCRWSGLKDTTITGKLKTQEFNESLFRFMIDNATIGFNWIFDRYFFSEWVYCDLGYKDYKFTEGNHYLKKLYEVAFYYDVSLVFLYANEETYGDRLNRDKPQYNDLKFDVTNSINQQNKYLEISDSIDRSRVFSIMQINTSENSSSEIADSILRTLDY